MADLSEKDSSQAVKIVGSDSSGIETNYIGVDANGKLKTNDIISTQGVQLTITVGTSAIELKVGATRLANRVVATLDNTSNSIIYWGYSASTTTTNYAGRIFKDQQASWSIGDVPIYVIAGSAGNSVRISEGA
jgi:hypothetical protein